MAAFIFHLGKCFEERSINFLTHNISAMILEIQAASLFMNGLTELAAQVINKEIPLLELKKLLKENYSKFAGAFTTYTIESWLCFVFWNLNLEKIKDDKLELIRNLLNKEFRITQNLFFDEGIDQFCVEFELSGEEMSLEEISSLLGNILHKNCLKHCLEASRACTLEDVKRIEDLAMEIFNWRTKM